MDTFRVRLNCVDHYQGSPSSFDPKVPIRVYSQKENVKPKVPIIRVFGATETGQKVCAHIHGALPYLYIKYNGSLVPDEVNDFSHQLQLSIDHALAISYRRNVNSDKATFVAHITLVKGVPFYGYHVGYEFFLKIYMLNPLNMTRLADLLRQGAIMRKPIQPFESHMQYLAQWMCDFNLYGCAHIDCQRVKFRSPVPEYLELEGEAHKWHDRTIGQSDILDENLLPKQSHCSLEIDVRVEDILNRRDVSSRPIHHDFVELKKPFPVGDKLVQSMASLWRDETRRRKMRMGLKDPSSSPFPEEVLVSVSADLRNTQAGGWIHEEEFRERVVSIIKDEKIKSDGTKLDFGNYLAKIPFETHVQTSLESVGDLFEEKLANAAEERQSSPRLGKESRHSLNVPQVDETGLLSFMAEASDVGSDEESTGNSEFTKQQRHREKVEQASVTTKADAKINGHHERSSKPVPVGSIAEQAGAPPARSRATMTATELAAMGVHDACEPICQDDIFELDEDFTSNIEAERKVLSGTESGPPSKRRKTVHQGLEGSETRNMDQSNSIDPRPERHLPPPEAPEEHIVAHKVPSSSALSSQDRTRDELMRTDVNAAGGSQWPNKGTSSIGRLSFPIVKNPHEPRKIKSLTQENDKSPSSSQRSEEPSMTRSSPADSKPRSTDPTTFPVRPSSPPPKLSNQTKRCCAQVRTAFNVEDSTRLLYFSSSPLSAVDVQSDMKRFKSATVIHRDAFYGRESDVPERAREYAGKEFILESHSVSFLPLFDASGASPASMGNKPKISVDRHVEESAYSYRRLTCSLRTWEIRQAPPDRREVQQWLDTGEATDNGDDPVNAPAGLTTKADVSQIDYSTQKNKHGFKYSQKQKSTSVKHEAEYMSMMSLEVHVNTRNSFVPNPEQDQVCCIFWCLRANASGNSAKESSSEVHLGAIVLSEDGDLTQRIDRQTSVEVEGEPSELDLINRMVDTVRFWDPDILTGYEVHGSSWGYLIERARLKYDYNLCDEFSRVKSDSHGRFGKEEDRWGFNHTSTIRVTGRHMINVWRAMRGELNLLQYTMENVVFQLCHRRIPHYAFSDLTTWYSSGKARDLAKVLDYYISRVQLDLEILDQNELIPRTSEQARLLGIDFFSVFSRGSQFKVESLMFRIAKPESLLLPSPSRKQVGQQNALECLPLVMEPQSSFFSSPVLVLDFQSLYPSIMIAYNYCYSTCLGRVVEWRGQNKMGFTEYHRQPRLLELLQNHINIAPNGIMYARPEIRKSLLAKMLGEILETRVMVKSGMKIDKDDRTLQRLLNNRQLALKLIANVTYGYTSASFSGRMPCSEIADSIVQTGRETLEKAIALVHSVDRWGAEVVYGDTDSLFVHLKGRTKDEAFDIGQEIATAITNMNPRPVKLKFEKVYFPSILLAKKRYVGFKYESKDQKEPVFDAKGIETVRRDGTPAEQKIEEKALKILFRTADLSQVKQYFQSQCEKIMRGRVSIQDFCFAKEVKLGTYSDKGPPPPGALISTRRMLEDPRAEPQYGERVPYVVIAGGPGARLIDRCVAPEAVLHDDNTELDSEYYISKNLIPPLERIFNLVGANVRQWYDDMPKFQRIRRIDATALMPGKDRGISRKTLESYMKSSSCLVCREKLEEETSICENCAAHPERSLFLVQSRLNKDEWKATKLEHICRSCANISPGDDVKCDSKDCPVFYTRSRQQARLRHAMGLAQSVRERLESGTPKPLEW